MKIILTGAAGFIGSFYLSYLNSKGVDDALIVDAEPNAPSCLNLKDKKYSKYLTREALIKSLDQGLLQNIDGIIHLGACADTTMMDREFLALNKKLFEASFRLRDNLAQAAKGQPSLDNEDTGRQWKNDKK